jgi:hypothetical protein
VGRTAERKGKKGLDMQAAERKRAFSILHLSHDRKEGDMQLQTFRTGLDRQVYRARFVVLARLSIFFSLAWGIWVSK